VNVTVCLYGTERARLQSADGRGPSVLLRKADVVEPEATVPTPQGALEMNVYTKAHRFCVVASCRSVQQPARRTRQVHDAVQCAPHVRLLCGGPEDGHLLFKVSTFVTEDFSIDLLRNITEMAVNTTMSTALKTY